MLFVTDEVASVTQPVRRLRGFTRVTLEPGESVTVAFRIEADDLRFWADGQHRVLEPGDFTLTVSDGTDRAPARRASGGARMTLERLRDVVAGTVPNAIMPLFWQKGGPVEVVREEMERIADAGIGAVILEARPHPEYLGDGWWRDVDAVLEIARRRGMKVWFFDDDTFPTGHAGGAVEAAPAELRRHFLSERHTDAVGPARGASFIVERRALWGPEAAQEPGDLLRVLAFPRAEDSDELIGDPVDLTDRIVDGVLHWDIPDGWWRVFFLEVGEGGSERHAQHIDYLNAASTQLLIDTVYERIHERYADEFGATIAGFFSDEPGLYNDPDTFDFDSRLGKAVPLPWNDDVAARLSERLGQDAVPLLPLLWMPAGGREREVRYAFMDTVSRLYSENFSRRLGDWCRAHGVEYIGHVIEDNGSHARLGPGAGHYFRAMAGQDMAGVDIIGGQVVPGFSRGPFGNLGGAADGEFFHFGLAKLASSAAHLDPLKQGRAMCETIGAYGWYAGLRLFTWLTNHLLVRGVTHVVPHAFSPAPFPDPDCPPHFYARGNNPQYPLQHLLSAYTNRLSHLLQSGAHVAPFAVLYHADAEWLGEAMPFERPLRPADGGSARRRRRPGRCPPGRRGGRLDADARRRDVRRADRSGQRVPARPRRARTAAARRCGRAGGLRRFRPGGRRARESTRTP